jgi:hypothetical protein
VQRVILEVLGGPLSGSKAVLSPGQRLSVGCRTRADLVVPDERMAGLHFALSWDGARCTIKRQRNAPETLLGGRQVDDGEVANGGWIRAGSTDFMVHKEAATPPPLDPDAYWDTASEDELSPERAAWLRQEREPRRLVREAFEARQARARAMLTAADGPRFAVLDAGRSPRVRLLLRESVERCRSLYDGVEGEALAHVAPYLVELPPGSALLQRLVDEGFEKRWGIFLDYPGSFTDLRRHLRRYLMIADADAESRRRYYFRFYDPVVLRAFLPACREQQRADFCGEIRAFYAEGSFDEEMARLEGGSGEGRATAGLQLTTAQRQKMGDPAFVQRVMNHLKRYHLEDVYLLTDPVLHRRIVHGIEKGRGYGLTWAYSLTVFVSHMIRVNPQLDEHPAVRRALQDPAVPPDERIDRLAYAVSRSEWEEVGRWGDPAAYWKPIDASPSPPSPPSPPSEPGQESKP